MPEYITPKKRTGRPRNGTTAKVCLKCNKKRPLSDFGANTVWGEQEGRDCWCKECFSNIKDKESLQEYMWDNNRSWNDELWKALVSKADLILSEKPLYNDSSEYKKEAMRLSYIMAKNVAQIKSASVFEKHEINFDKAREAGMVSDLDPKAKRWSEEFQGDFTGDELAYMESYYGKLQEDFSFDNESLRDYARKICIASLLSNKAMNDYAAGKCDIGVVKDAMNMYDMLMKSANFAACKRKPGDTSGMTSWAETTLYLETHGKLKKNENEFKEDTIDRVINNYRHIITSIGLDEM